MNISHYDDDSLQIATQSVCDDVFGTKHAVGYSNLGNISCRHGGNKWTRSIAAGTGAGASVIQVCRLQITANVAQ